ncbi:hypothetical protein [Deinococcus sp. SL84]|uniref:hypothetical protein n=1 Tax=Deinococcus sp. SL84 TaxID=2994663 RepID=UPI002275C526|nr:hypothetical protein [Deinococcus sp. SL84]MCY1703904.1 hypothetical protein [Deinococcus sp. SL84]
MAEHVGAGLTQHINLAKILETEDYSLENIEAVALSLGGRAGADYFLSKRFPELGGRTPVEAIEEGDGERALGLLINY